MSLATNSDWEIGLAACLMSCARARRQPVARRISEYY